ncbi:hypothetical protein BH20ACI4_BH20ACI4_20250 [soil metagenome]
MMRLIEKKFMPVTKKSANTEKKRLSVKKRFFLRRKVGKVIVAEIVFGVSRKFLFNKFPAKIF